MYSYKRKRTLFRWTPWNLSVLLIPIVFILLFYAVRNQTSWMERWVNGGLYNTVMILSTVSSFVPFSLGEALVVLTVIGAVSFVVYRFYRYLCVGDVLCHGFHLWGICTVLAWLWLWMCWMWNPLYYIPSFAQRSGLDVSPYPVEDLQVVTAYFAEKTGEHSKQIPRTEELHFDTSGVDYFQSALSLYANLEKEYPFLKRENVKVKSLTFSKLQSMFGFTGVYIPFTGEANINVHTPAIFHPVTIAHEMAHQRLIAPELEANFLSVASSLDSDDPIFQYSGYLFGLIQLSNALYPVDSTLWSCFVSLYFTEEVTHDWDENYWYWQQFQSPVEEVAKDVYDGFLKSNNQDLGIRSYGACVDLLVSYYREDAWAWAKETGAMERWQDTISVDMEGEQGEDTGETEDSIEKERVDITLYMS